MKQLLLAITAVVLLVAGCSSPSGPTQTTVSRTAPNPMVGKDARIRPVPALSGEALTFARPDTASQVICQALTSQQWQEVTGGPVGRYANAGEHLPCLIAATVNLEFYLVDRDPQWRPSTTFGGRPARTDMAKDGALTASVALVDAPTRPVLHVEPKRLNGLSAEAQLALLTRVLDRLVPVLARPSEPMPKADKGRLHFVKTQPPTHGGIIDEPSPRQALELCTVLVDHAGYKPAQVTPLATGSCQARKPGKEQLTVAITGMQHPSTDSYDLSVAGRPAALSSEEVNATDVRLIDAAYTDLVVGLPYDDPLLATIVRALMG